MTETCINGYKVIDETVWYGGERVPVAEFEALMAWAQEKGYNSSIYVQGFLHERSALADFRADQQLVLPFEPLGHQDQQRASQRVAAGLMRLARRSS